MYVTIFLKAAELISALAFLFYGFQFIFNPKFTTEFERYKLPALRQLTGILEIAGALGIVGGHFYHHSVWLAALGLAILMIFAIITRIRIRDTFIQILPAVVLLALNVFIVWGELQ